MLQRITINNFDISKNDNAEISVNIIDYRYVEYRLAAFGSAHTSTEEDTILAEMFIEHLVSLEYIDLDNIFIEDPKQKAEVDENNLRTDTMREE